mmetsp:Transcript_19874/g.24530  ORF Transcript_19874/g.24530 Transcript_19874/m.24530 type:complete len:140 (-) Transcript_19874:170-589(-)|eukprot:CAMPEP_0172496392 /NCGR_PEP_ID=MMETSP1066-20121228/86638_1 /TAXON_ID=671091 /ORGANISM="Coscinodiscus wailesii, Strain CCMP2513" /LENGTH=139 /DNA_ID=CAMNT_0013268669 /DNA_START=137 /DNA_END=556 /DNA_ORIENTATION=+
MSNGNIFFTKDNLVLSLPLIGVCTSYAFFKFVPLPIGVPLIVGAGLVLHLRSKFHARRIEQSVSEIDDNIINELSADDDRKKAKSKAKLAKKERKANERLKQRLSVEKKLERQGGGDDDEDEDDALLDSFAKRNGKKKK